MNLANPRLSEIAAEVNAILAKRETPEAAAKTVAKDVAKGEPNRHGEPKLQAS